MIKIGVIDFGRIRRSLGEKLSVFSEIAVIPLMVVVAVCLALAGCWFGDFLLLCRGYLDSKITSWGEVWNKEDHHLLFVFYATTVILIIVQIVIELAIAKTSRGLKKKVEAQKKKK